jgi:GH25 family lysozyme M1 (1,4-beta-N-acetylmuramidase)
MRPLGIDLSRYNTSADGKVKVDFDAFKAAGVSYVACRAGISWGYADAWFAYYWSELKRVQIPRLAYHVIYFGESPEKQVDNLFRIIGPDFDPLHDRIVLDLEVAGTNTKLECTYTTKKAMEIVRARTDRYPILYSRASWVNEHLYAGSLPVSTDWWLAQYRLRLPYPLYTPESVPPPPLPRGVTSWLIHQTGEYCPSIGVSGRRYMDYNRWNGDELSVLAYFGYGELIPPEPPVDYLFQALFKATALTKRDKPKTGKVVGYVLAGEVVKVYEIDSTTGWYRIDAGTWVSGNQVYWERI